MGPPLVRSGNMMWMRWSPDGTQISYDDGGSIHVVDVASGQGRLVTDGGENAEWFDASMLSIGNPTT